MSENASEIDSIDENKTCQRRQNKEYEMRLFRYRPLGQGLTKEREEQELDSLSKSYLWLSPYKSLNDPMEAFEFEVETPPLQDRAFAELGLDIEPFRRKAEASINLFKSTDNFNVCSFSDTCENLSMWAYYANNFRGMVIEYDMEEMLRQHLGLYFARVQYFDRLPRLSMDTYYGNEDLVTAASCCIKHQNWAHEREWRLFGMFSGMRAINPTAIKRVFVGPRIERKTITKILSIAERIGFSVSKLNISSFQLHTDKIKETSPYIETSGSQIYFERCDSNIPQCAMKLGVPEADVYAVCEKIRNTRHCESIAVIGTRDDASGLIVQTVMQLPSETQKTFEFQFTASGGGLSKKPDTPHAMQRSAIRYEIFK